MGQILPKTPCPSSSSSPNKECFYIIWGAWQDGGAVNHLTEVNRMIQMIAKTLIGLWLLAQPFQAVEGTETCCAPTLSIDSPT